MSIGQTTANNLLDIGMDSGNNSTAKTADFSTLNLANTATSTSPFTKTGTRISSTGSWTDTNIGLYVTAVSGGNVGIGTTPPAGAADH